MTESLQIPALKAMYSLWPKCPVEVARQYIRDSLGAELDEIAVEAAKADLGLAAPQEPDEKRAYQRARTEEVLLTFVTRYGVAGLSVERFCSVVGHAVSRETGAPRQLVNGWVRTFLKELEGDKNDLEYLRGLLLSATAARKAAGAALLRSGGN